MQAIKVRVESGRIVGEAPKGIPDGTELDLCFADPDDGLTEGQLAELNAALEAGWQSMQAGRVRPAADVIAEVRAAR